MSDLPDLPGDPTRVKNAATNLQATADALGNALRVLKNLGDLGSTSSDAAEELVKRGAEAKSGMATTQTRYADTAAALRTYSVALEDAQKKAKEASGEYSDAVDAASTASAKQNTAKQQARTAALNGSVDEDAVSRASAAATALATAKTAQSAARAKYDTAKNDLDAAARVCITSIEAAADKSGQTKYTWGDFWEDLVQVAEWVAAVAGVLAIVLAAVPFVGALMGAIALIAGAIVLADSIIRAAQGKGSWWEVAIDAGSMILAVFGGKLIGQLIKKPVSMLTGKSFLAAGKTASQKGAPSFRSLVGAGNANKSMPSATVMAQGKSKAAVWVKEPKGFFEKSFEQAFFVLPRVTRMKPSVVMQGFGALSATPKLALGVTAVGVGYLNIGQPVVDSVGKSGTGISATGRIVEGVPDLIEALR